MSLCISNWLLKNLKIDLSNALRTKIRNKISLVPTYPKLNIYEFSNPYGGDKKSIPMDNIRK
jgi:hypothetical protein